MTEPDDLELLLSEPPSKRNWAAIYKLLRVSVWEAAAQGARTTGVRDSEAIGEAVLNAFREFMKQDFAEVDKPRALARRIAYLRGIDRGRAMRKQWAEVAPVEEVSERHLRAVPEQPDGLSESAEESFLSDEELEERERTHWQAKKCLGRLEERERYVIKEHVMGGRTLSDVGEDLKISHTTVRNIRERALPLLRACMEEHLRTDSDGGGGGHE